MKAKFLILSIVIVFGFLFLYGIRFSKVGLIRKIPFSKIENIRCDFWKYSGGESCLGDFIDFDGNNTRVTNDTIYINKEPVGLVLEATKRYFADDCQIIIESFEDKKKAYYVAK